MGKSKWCVSFFVGYMCNTLNRTEEMAVVHCSMCNTLNRI